MFRGLRRTALAILTLALILTFPVTASATDAGFSDVPETAPYHDSVVYLSERQIVTGTGGGQLPFGNGRSCSAEPMVSK